MDPEGGPLEKEIPTLKIIVFRMGIELQGVYRVYLISYEQSNAQLLWHSSLDTHYFDFVFKTQLKK